MWAAKAAMLTQAPQKAAMAATAVRPDPAAAAAKAVTPILRLAKAAQVLRRTVRTVLISARKAVTAEMAVTAARPGPVAKAATANPRAMTASQAPVSAFCRAGTIRPAIRRRAAARQPLRAKRYCRHRVAP